MQYAFMQLKAQFEHLHEHINSALCYDDYNRYCAISERNFSAPLSPYETTTVYMVPYWPEHQYAVS
jgi:hypothetical protein